MKMLSVCGPPSSGKSSVIIKAIEVLQHQGLKIGVVKFDCLTTFDDMLYRGKGIKVEVGLSGSLCPDHFFVSNIEACHQWGTNKGLDLLISESAGLCNRCSPHIKDVLAVCVIDNLMGVNTPGKIGPMLKFADIVVITKGDIVSQAEREVFRQRVEMVNPDATVLAVNGLNGQGSLKLKKNIMDSTPINEIEGKELRCSMPAAICSYCTGETMIGSSYQMGNVKKVSFGKV